MGESNTCSQAVLRPNKCHAVANYGGHSDAFGVELMGTGHVDSTTVPCIAIYCPYYID